MIFKKIVLILIFVALISVSAANAADLNDDMLLNQDISTVDSMDSVSCLNEIQEKSIINCNAKSNLLRDGESDLEIEENNKEESYLESEDLSFNYHNCSDYSVFLKDKEGNPIAENPINFTFVQEDKSINFEANTDYNGRVRLSEELNNLTVGLWNLSVLFKGNNLFKSSSSSSAISVSPSTPTFDFEIIPSENEFILEAYLSFLNEPINEGFVAFYVNDKFLTRESVYDGLASFRTSSFYYGNYNFTAVFEGENFLSANATGNVSINKFETNVDLHYVLEDFISCFCLDTLSFEVTVDSNGLAVNEGQISVYINDVMFNKLNVSNGNASFDFSAEDAGIYNIRVIFEESRNYLSSSTSLNLIVQKAYTSLRGESLIFHKDNEKIFSTNLTNFVVRYGELEEDRGPLSNQTIQLIIEDSSGKKIELTNSSNEDGIANFNLTDLACGIYYVSGKFNGTDNYAPSSFKNEVIIIKSGTILSIGDIQDIYLGFPTKFFTYIFDESGNSINEGSLEFLINGQILDFINITNETSNPFEFDYIPLELGNFTFSVIFNGTDLYDSSNISMDFEVRKYVEYVNITILPNATISFTNEENGIVLITLTDLDGISIANEELKVSINGKESIIKTDDMGKAIVFVEGNATIVASYIDANNLTTTGFMDIIVINNIIEINNTIEVPIIRNASQIEYFDMDTVAVNTAADGRIGEYFKVTLKDAKGNILTGKSIKIGFNGKIYNKTTNENGSAKLQINLAREGIYTFAVSFLGDDNYNGSFVVAKINVAKQSPKLTTANKSYKASAKIKTLTATLKTAKGNPIKNKKITFTLNGKNYVGITNSKGIVSVKVSLSKKGTYSFSVKYYGDNTFNSVTKKAKLGLSKN